VRSLSPLTSATEAADSTPYRSTSSPTIGTSAPSTPGRGCTVRPGTTSTSPRTRRPTCEASSPRQPLALVGFGAGDLLGAFHRRARPRSAAALLRLPLRLPPPP